MDEDIVALLAIFVVLFAAYSGLPLLDPASIRRRSQKPPGPPTPSAEPRRPPPPRHVAETFAQKAAQRRATRITR